MIVAPLVYGASPDNGFSGATEPSDVSALEFADRAAQPSLVRARASATLSLPVAIEMSGDDLSAFGRLSALAERTAKQRAFEDVVRPVLRSLLDASAEALPHVAAMPS